LDKYWVEVTTSCGCNTVIVTGIPANTCVVVTFKFKITFVDFTFGNISPSGEVKEAKFSPPTDFNLYSIVRGVPLKFCWKEPVFSFKTSPFVAYSLKIIKSTKFKSNPTGKVALCPNEKSPLNNSFPPSFLTPLLLTEVQ